MPLGDAGGGKERGGEERRVSLANLLVGGRKEGR